jgi:Mg-chelatase subunit ChlD
MIVSVYADGIKKSLLGVAAVTSLWACGQALPNQDDSGSEFPDVPTDGIISDLGTRPTGAESGDTDEGGGGGDDDDDTKGDSDGSSSPSSDNTGSGTESHSDDGTLSDSDTTASSSEDSGTSESTASSDDSSEDSSSTDGSDCAKLNVNFSQVIPTVLLVVDQSGSMANQLSSTVTRWQGMRDALIDGADALIPKFEAEIRFGLALFSGDFTTCPTFSSVASSLDNFAAIQAKLDDSAPYAGTPTGEAFAMALDLMETDIAEGPRIFILVTDGEPSTCANLNMYNGQTQSLEAVSTAYDAGFETFVIGVGTNVSAEHLQQLANVGQGVDAEAGDSDDVDVYQATNPDALADAFKTIINGVRPCKFTLEKAIVDGYEDQGTVTIEGMELVLDDPNGWRVNSPTEIEFLGDACTQLQEGTLEVHVEFPCEAIEPG